MDYFPPFIFKIMGAVKMKEELSYGLIQGNSHYWK